MTLPNRASEQGFTLLEMIVTIAVMGLILAMLTSFGPPRNHWLDTKGAAARIASMMRMAQQRAIVEDRPVALTLPRLPDWMGVAFEPNAGIVFEPDGSSSGGEVVLRDDARRLIVRADWLTGRVTLIEP